MIPPMPASAPLVLAFLITLWLGLALLYPGEGGRPLVVGLAPVEERHTPLPSAPTDASSPPRAAALAELTADDLARGVWALGSTTSAPELTGTQRAQLAAVVDEAARLRSDLGEHRMAQRAAQRTLLADGVALAGALGEPRVAALARGNPAAPVESPR